MIISIIIANVIVIFSEEQSKHSVSLWTLNITAATASILCIIVLCRYGIHELHSKSYLFIALGIYLSFLQILHFNIIIMHWEYKNKDL